MIHEIPEKESVEIFKSGIWEEEKQHNNDTEWIRQIKNSNQNVPEQLCSDISTSGAKIAIQNQKPCQRITRLSHVLLQFIKY